MRSNHLQAVSPLWTLALSLLLPVVPLGAQEVDFEYACVVLSDPSTVDQVTSLPEGITEVGLGATFYVELWATDSGSTNTGIVCAYADLDYPEGCVVAGVITHGDFCDLFESGTDTGSTVDELGCCQLGGDVGVEPEWVRIAYIELTAVDVCESADFQILPAEAESSAYIRGLVPPSDIDYGSCGVSVRLPPPLPENSLGITDCTADEECANEAKCVLGTCYAPKHRYISISRNPEQVEHTARRISLQGGGAGPWWVGAPYEASGFTVADVVEAPVYADTDFTGDWPDLVNVTGCEIAPNQTYLVQAIAEGQEITEEANYSAAISLHTPTVWGDVVSTCLYHSCQPPNGEVNIDDILAGIAAFQSANNDPLTWFDIAPALGDGVPNQMVDIDDILANIQGFQSKVYPGLGPLDCP